MGGALASVGIPKDSIIKYEAAIKTDKYLVMLDGTEQQLLDAQVFIEDHPGSSI
ncbi:hypothetical protein AB4428_14745 [Vibrio lentus]